MMKFFLGWCNFLKIECALASCAYVDGVKLFKTKTNIEGNLLLLILFRTDLVNSIRFSIVGANLGMTGKMISTPFEAIDVGLGTYLAPSGGYNTKYENQMFVFVASL